jgi:hypothetical protein
MRRLVLVLAACGGTATGGGDGPGDATSTDTTGATCGDQVCGGGELCAACADCKTREPVCGNGACDPGEAPACVDDCGPDPWMWTAQEQQLVDLVNAARTGGTQCPNGALATAPALTFEPGFTPQAHEWVWEIAHQDFVAGGGGACNGRTFADRMAAGGFVSFVLGKDHATVDETIAAWKASATLCPILMNASRTRIATGVAFDEATGFIAVFD